MSVTNGKAPVASVNGHDRVRGLAPENVARPRGDVLVTNVAPDVRRGGADPRLGSDLAARVDAARDRLRYQDEPALVEWMTDDELAAEREVAALRRATGRRLAVWRIKRSVRAEKWQARREAWRAGQDRRAAARDRGAAGSDHRWHLRAERVRRRLTSVDARIGTQIRSATIWSHVLITLMVLGMAYTGFTVQTNFVPGGTVTDPRWWLALGLEAMCSVALMALMRYDARAALAGITRAGKHVAWAWVVKAVLLLASVVAAAGPAMVAGDVLGIVATGWAPVLVAGVLVIHDHITRGDQGILASLNAAAQRDELRDLVVITEFALRQGLLPPSQTNEVGDVAPSASKIATFLRISKERAAAVRDAVNANATAA